MLKLTCLHCGKEFETERKRKFCCRKCMQQHWHTENYKSTDMKANICVFCGKEFKSKKEAQFCSDLCNKKYNRRKIKKYCVQCNKEMETGRSKYCSEKCRREYYNSHPLHKKICAGCGKEYKTNNLRQKYCTAECQREFKWESTVKKRESNFKEQFKTKYPEFEYVSGYTNWRSFIKCKCKTCGCIQERSAMCIKPEKTTDMKCDNCIKIKTLRGELINILVRRHNDVVREHNKETRLKEEQVRRIEREKQLQGYVCKECGRIFDATQTSQKYCTTECANKHATRIKEVRRRKRLRENGKIEWDISLDKLINRDKNMCHICGEECESSDCMTTEEGYFIAGERYPSIDHVIPVAKGGTHTWRNVKLAHRGCNTIKNDKIIYEETIGQLRLF